MLFVPGQYWHVALTPDACDSLAWRLAGDLHVYVARFESRHIAPDVRQGDLLLVLGRVGDSRLLLLPEDVWLLLSPRGMLTARVTKDAVAPGQSLLVFHDEHASVDRWLRLRKLE